MLKINADDARTGRRLAEIARLCATHGGWFHPQITAVAEQGQLRVESGLEPADNSPLIYLPESCLPGVDDFDITLSGTRLAAAPRDAKVSSLHADLMAAMLELFNLAEKIREHRQTFPWLVFASHEDILAHLASGRSVSDNYRELLGRGELDALAVASFLGARYLNFHFRGTTGTRRVLMPVIDCLNHHGGAVSYLEGSHAPEVEKGLMVRNSKPCPGSAECFVRYTKADMLGAYLSYGFLDASASVLRSVPMTIDLPGGLVISVFAYTYTHDADWIPPGLEDIRYHVPHIRRASPRELHVSHLMIPAAGGSALRRILETLITGLDPKVNRKTLKALVRESETSVLERNRDYYLKLRELASGKPREGTVGAGLEVLERLARGQLERLSAYRRGRS